MQNTKFCNSPSLPQSLEHIFSLYVCITVFFRLPLRQKEEPWKAEDDLSVFLYRVGGNQFL